MIWAHVKNKQVKIARKILKKWLEIFLPPNICFSTFTFWVQAVTDGSEEQKERAPALVPSPWLTEHTCCARLKVSAHCKLSSLILTTNWKACIVIPMLQINEDLEKLKKLTHVSKVTLELRLYLKETALEGTLMQMNQEGISDFIN